MTNNKANSVLSCECTGVNAQEFRTVTFSLPLAKESFLLIFRVVCYLCIEIHDWALSGKGLYQQQQTLLRIT